MGALHHRRVKALFVAGALALGLTLAGCRDEACPTPDLSTVPLLDDAEKTALSAYLGRHPDLRVPDDSECGCGEEIAQMRAQGDGGQPMPDYEPFILRGDFNGDGEEDFAVMLARANDEDTPAGVLVIFNGPFSNYSPAQPAAAFKFAFGKYMALFRAGETGELLMGQFESEGCLYAPQGNSYDEQCGEDD